MKFTISKSSDGWGDNDYEKEINSLEAWSEEDEKMLNYVIIDIESLKEQVYCRTLCDEEIDWLKSLRPQSWWKPTDEQMDALESAVSSLQSTALESLYQDLTKNK